MKSSRILSFSIAALTGMFVSLSSSALGATINKADNPDDLNLTTSWSGGLVPTALDTAVWSGLTGANTVSLGSNLSWLGLTAGATGGPVTIGGANTLTLGTSGINMSAASQDLTISSNLTLGAGNQSWNVATGKTLTLNIGTFTRSAGATLLIDRTANTGTVATTNITNANSIVGPWAMIRSTGTAAAGTADGYTFTTVSGGNIVAYTGAMASTGFAFTSNPNTNFDISGTGAVIGSHRSANTIRYVGAAGTTTSSGTVTLTANAILNAGSGTLGIGGGANTLNVGIGATGELVLAAANAGIRINNAVTGSGRVTIVGPNTVTFASTGSYTGATSINSGTLQLGAGGTTGQLSATTSIVNNGNLTINRSNSFTQTTNLNDNIISGSGSFTQAGAGTTTLSLANTYTGLTTISAGILALSGGNNRLLSTGTVAFAGTSAFDVGSTSQTLAAITVPNATSNSTINGSGGTLAIIGSSDLEWGQGTSGVGITNGASTTVNLSGLSNFAFNAPSNDFRVGYKSGTSNANISTVASQTVTLAASNTITAAVLGVGDVAASSHGGTSTLRLGAANTLNVGSINVGFVNRSNATLEFAAPSSAVTIRNTDGSSAVTSWNIGSVNNPNPATFTDSVDLSNGTVDALVTSMTIGQATSSGSGTRTGTTTASFAMAAGTLTTGTMNLGVFQGNNAVSGTMEANGTFTLNSASGTLNVNTLTLATNTTLATGGTRNVNGTFNLIDGTLNATTIQKGSQTGTATATTAFNWTNGTISNISGGNLAIINTPITLFSGTHTFNISGTNTATLDANSAIGGGAFDITKSGSGTLTFSASNTYTGDTSVTAGTLLVNNTTGSGTGTGAVTIGANGTLGGSGTISGDTTINGRHNAGNPAVASGVGTQSFGGNLSYGNDSIFNWDLNANKDADGVGEDDGVAGSDFDSVAVTGDLNVGTNAVFNVILGSGVDLVSNAFWNTPSITQEWSLEAIFGKTFTSGSFASVTSTADPVTQGSFSINGSTLTWSAVPEPTSALAGLLIGAGLLRRRRD